MEKVLAFWHATLSIGSLHGIFTLSGKLLHFNGKKIYKAYGMFVLYGEWN